MIEMLFQGSIIHLGALLIILLALQTLIRVIFPKFRLPTKLIFYITLLGGIISLMKNNLSLLIPIIIGLIALYGVVIVIRKYYKRR